MIPVRADYYDPNKVIINPYVAPEYNVPTVATPALIRGQYADGSVYYHKAGEQPPPQVKYAIDSRGNIYIV